MLLNFFERIEDGKLSAYKVTFGSEPKDYKIWEYVWKKYNQLKFSPDVDEVVKKEATNPKRVQREAEKQRQFELKQLQKREKQGALMPLASQ